MCVSDLPFPVNYERKIESLTRNRMASQGEREPGVEGMDEGVLESMVQDGDPEQEMLVVEEQELPQTDPEPEMGAAAASVCDALPPHLRQNPSPTPSETATDNGGSVLLGPSDIKQVMEMMQQMTQRLMQRMDAHTQAFINDARALRGEMRQMGRSLQAGMKAIVCSKTQTAREKMATPRAATNELGGVQRLSGPQWRRVRTG